MRTTEQKFPIIVALLVAIFLCSIPDYASAQAPPPAFNNQECRDQVKNAYMKAAQDKVVEQQKVYANAPLPSIKAVYCWATIQKTWQDLNNTIDAMGGLTGGGIGAIIKPLIVAVLQPIFADLLNAICGTISSAAAMVTSYIRNIVCLPLPRLTLTFNFASFTKGACGGGTTSLLDIIALSGERSRVSPAWGVWGRNSQF